MWRNVVTGIAIVAVAATTAIWVGGSSGNDPADGATGDRPIATSTVAALETFGACDDLTDWLGRNAAAYVTPWGLEGGFGIAMMGGVADDAGGFAGTTGGDGGGTAGEGDVAFSAPAAEAAGRSATTPEFSGTNVQEVGVDEPDTVKTDGRRLFTVRQGQVLHVDLTGSAPAIVGRFDLPSGPHGDTPWQADLLLHEDRLLVMWRSWSEEGFDGFEEPAADAALSSFRAPGRSITRVALLDVSADTPRLLETADLDGDFVSGRLHGTAVRIVVRNQPFIPMVHAVDGSLASQRLALQRNREIVRSAPASQWLPWVRVTDHAGGAAVTSERPMVRCEDVHHPGGFAGLGSLDVVTLPLDGSLDDLHATSVLTGADTVYASTEHLYVTSYRWHEPVPFEERWLEDTGGSTGEVGSSAVTVGGDAILVEPDVGAPAPDRAIAPRQPQQDFATHVHAFSLADPAATAYIGSGEVPGHVLNQFSLSEHDGHLRVATTVGAPWNGGSESGVHVLALEEGRLREVGNVRDLGRGERIYAVRFVGDTGYVVTFRQIDPLYTLDLSDETRPRVLGELKIPGYSAYLHPVSEDLLLGIGQDASLEGRTQGTQVSLFDVSDLRDPRQVAKSTIEQGSSDAEFDHRAFLYWPATGLTVVPVSVWGQAQPWSGALAFEVDREARTLDRVGSVSHLDHAVATVEPGFAPEERVWVGIDRGRITRSLVVGDRLLTLSEAGLLATTMDTLEETSWLAFVG